jgi:hypothetical protein
MFPAARFVSYIYVFLTFLTGNHSAVQFCQFFLCKHFGHLMILQYVFYPEWPLDFGFKNLTECNQNRPFWALYLEGFTCQTCVLVFR